MPTERVDIVVSERGAKVVERNLADIGKAATGSDASVRLLTRALSLIATYAGISQLIKMIDTYNNFQNRLRIVTTTTENLAAVTEQLFDVANRTRATYASTADLYARLALSSRELGVSQKDLVTFTERVNEAVIISGASAQEASAGLIQLAQGIASGTLRGDELRSVLEQLPKVADVIAEHLGITRGELRLLGAQGKITAKQVIDAFLSADDLAEEFAKTAPTISQAFNVLNNNVMRSVGEFDKASGASTKFASAIISIANNLDTIVKWITVLSSGLAVLVGPAVLGKAVGLFTSLWRLLAKNPLVLLIAAVVGTITHFALFDEQIDKSITAMGRSITMIDRVAAAWAGTKAYIQSAWENFPEWLASMFIRAINGAIGLLGKFINFVGDSLGELLHVDNGHLDLTSWLIPEPDRFAKAGDAAATAYKDAFTQSLKDTTMTLPDSVSGEAGAGKPPHVVDKNAERALKKLKSDLRQVQDTVDPVAAAWREWGDAQDTVEKSLAKGLITLDEYNALLGQAFRYYEDMLFPIDAEIKDLTRQREELGFEADARERLTKIYDIEDKLKRKLTDAEKTRLDQELKLTQQKKAEADMYDEIVGPMTNYEKKLTALNALTGKISADDYTKKLRQIRLEYLELDKTLDGGLERGILKVQDQFTDLASVTETAIVNAFQGMEDALVSFVSTGKLDFKSLADSIVADIDRIVIRSQITAPLAKLLGADGGAGGSGSGGGGLSGIFGSVVGAIFGGSVGAAETAANISGSMGGDAIGTLINALPGFRDGGSFDVGGAGGTDSQLIAFRATPGENVQISRPEQSSNGGGTKVYMTINTPDADSFRRSRNQIMAEIGAATSRAQRRNR